MGRKKESTTIDESKLKTVLDIGLVKALSHSVRGHIIATLNERIASPREIAGEIDLDVSYVSYHIRVLNDIGFIELVKTAGRRGATEHFYRAKTSVLLEGSDWDRLPATVQSDFNTSIVKSIFDDVAAAVQADRFVGRDDDMHLSWTPGAFDERGWRQQLALLKATLAQSMEIQRASAERLAESGKPGISASVAILGFQTSDRSAERASEGGDLP